MSDDNQDRPDNAASRETADKAKKAASASPPLPAITFATFLFSLNSSALVQLGMMDDPLAGTKTKNLALAKQTIDVISMLEEKTRGNLDADEATMIKNILYDLRILYVKEKG